MFVEPAAIDDDADRALAPTLDDVLRALEASLSDIGDRARDIRALGITPELLDALIGLRFLRSRLQRRLESLADGGLLALSARRSAYPVAVVEHVVVEIASECGRRGVKLRADLADENVRLTIDTDQLTEALRGIFDEALLVAREGDELSVTTRALRADALEIEIDHRGLPTQPSLSTSGIAFILDGDAASGVTVHRRDERRGYRLVVSSPPDIAPPCTREWLFPVPAA
jgi:hypothetical protein